MSKKVIGIIIAIAVVILAAYAIYRSQDNDATNTAQNTNDSFAANQGSTSAGNNNSGTANSNDNASPTNGTTNNGSQNGSGSGSNGSTNTNALAYTDALKKYGTNRIQFDTNCQARPNNVTFKSGTEVMFDNRAAVARTITFNGVKYTIGADSYKVFTMTAPSYPATTFIDCGSAQNVATILIQK